MLHHNDVTWTVSLISVTFTKNPCTLCTDLRKVQADEENAETLNTFIDL